MPEQCDICGIAALESEHFTMEALPFGRTKRYCPACSQRFYRRLFAVLALIPMVVGAGGIYQALHWHMSVLESSGVQWSLLLTFQWLMVLPHELGHAAAAWAFGFRQIRILIGGGKPLVAFRLLGIPTLVNLIPFGGATLSKPPQGVARWRYAVFAGGGLLVNLTAAVIAACFVAPGKLFSLHSGSLATPFFWANVLVLTENLFPHQVQTPYDPLDSDGLLLWKVVLRWNKPRQLKPARLPAWVIALRHLLKWTGFLVMAGCAVLWGVVAALPFLEWDGSAVWGNRIVLVALMLALVFVTGWAAVRIAKHPVATVANPGLSGELGGLLSLAPEQIKLLRQANDCAQQKDFAAAEALVDQVLATVPEDKASGCRTLLLLKLDYITSQNDIARAEELCRDWVERAVTTEEKVRILDGLACQILYKSATGWWDRAERAVRQALALAPGRLTLQGSLGAILVEQGRFVEAEPLLRECLERSPALHDQGISAFYLGMMKLRTGDRGEARRLIKRGMVLYAEPWLLAKAEALLKELES